MHDTCDPPQQPNISLYAFGVYLWRTQHGERHALTRNSSLNNMPSQLEPFSVCLHRALCMCILRLDCTVDRLAIMISQCWITDPVVPYTVLLVLSEVYLSGKKTRIPQKRRPSTLARRGEET